MVVKILPQLYLGENVPWGILEHTNGRKEREDVEEMQSVTNFYQVQ